MIRDKLGENKARRYLMYLALKNEQNRADLSYVSETSKEESNSMSSEFGSQINKSLRFSERPKSLLDRMIVHEIELLKCPKSL